MTDVQIINDLNNLIERTTSTEAMLASIIDSGRRIGVRQNQYAGINAYLEELSENLLDLLRERAIEIINHIVGVDNFSGLDMGGHKINGFRAAEIAVALLNNADCSNSNTEIALPCLADLLVDYPEISGVVLVRIIDEIKDDLPSISANDQPTLLSTYQTAIQNAFGMLFTVSQDAEPWNLMSLHFSRQGLEATAQAFERWAAPQSATYVNGYAIFRRVFGQITLNNCADTWENFACSSIPIINIYQRPKKIFYWQVPDGSNGFNYLPRELANGESVSTPPPVYTADNVSLPQFPDDIYTPGRDVGCGCNGGYQPIGRSPAVQAIMTPNNLIHELGHAFSRFAGFGTQRIGSMENAINNESMSLTREGMGPAHLRELFYEHAQVENTNPVTFTVIDGTKIPQMPDPENYLMYDVYGDVLSNWQRNEYTAFYGSRTRIDTYVHNADETNVETAADAFLNWVRGSFQDDDDGVAWEQFFDTYIGVFLRNASIYNYPEGSVRFYLEGGLIYEPSETRPIDPTSLARIRLAPLTVSSTDLGKAFDPNKPDEDNDLEQTNLFGWADVEQANGATIRWFAIRFRETRLVWIADFGIIAQATDIAAQRRISNPLYLSPGRVFEADDLSTILGG